MSSFEITRETLEVYPHPDADRLELARVGLYNIVVAKGVWQTGDEAFYIPEQAILPDRIIQHLGLEGKLAGSAANRVKAVRLRGAVSQGLVAPLNLVSDEVLEEIGLGDYADALGITKWQPEIPASLSGEVRAASQLIPWIDLEHIKRFPDLFTEGEQVIVDEKIHGTASLFTFVDPLDDGEVLVSSKGLAQKNLALLESESVLYWKVLTKYNLRGLAEAVASHIAVEDGEESIRPGVGRVTELATVSRIGVFGETFGSKVQDLHYGAVSGDFDFRLFDIFVEYHLSDGTSHRRWLQPHEVARHAAENSVPLVPRLYEGPYSEEVVADLATGAEQVSGRELHIREGVVVRPSRRGTDARIGKYVSDAYLTRKNATEFQ